MKPHVLQYLLEVLAGIIITIHHQGPQPGQALRNLQRNVCRAAERQVDLKAASLLGRTFQLDAATHEFSQIFCNGQSQSAAAKFLKNSR